ncbi:hypothetical protein [Methylobacterium brachythecii]|uniref:PepSY domain-containing protein n=1 Tax=Methylobacterium brachythecii TaxID=1176177 RepID=A0A7W6AP75_9HYPH|nr:hypothetical protein [Methylobacterium brachythecii]MBB3903317.1 hypothetical protein [Methylobacterium brachythecii]GLS46832.1 hypothetical protein GCM10007884_48290 [Methylobacterium brachythecii]
MSRVGKATVAGLFALGWFGALAVASHAGGFDGRAWKAAYGSTERKNPRAAMVEEVKAALETGMTREAIIDRLGPPEIEKDGVLTYALGVGGFGVDYSYLVLRLDGGGRLSSVSVSRG